MMVQALKWDSRFFNLKIGKINNLSQAPLTDELQKYDLVYIESLNAGKLNKKLAAHFHIVFTDKKTIYLKSVDKNPEKPDKNISTYPFKTANKKLTDIAVQSGAYSRFKLDTHFKKDDYKKLYIKWIHNSVAKKSADAVLIYGPAKNPEGFITLIYKDKLAQIGLIAVDAASQNKGIGKALINAAEYFALKKRITTLQVITQTENRNACKFYEKRGFKKDAIIYTHHHWNK